MPGTVLCFINKSNLVHLNERQVEFSFLEADVISELVSDLSGSVVPREHATLVCYLQDLWWFRANVVIVLFL